MKCEFFLKSGKQCSRKVLFGSEYCWQHKTNENNIIENKIDIINNTENKQIYNDIDLLAREIIPNCKITNEACEFLCKIIKYLSENKKNYDYIVRQIFSTASLYMGHGVLNYYEINKLIAYNNELITMLKPIVILNKYITFNLSVNMLVSEITITKSFSESEVIQSKADILSDFIIKNTFDASNIKISKDALIFILKYIYWNFKNLDNDIKFGTLSNTNNIIDFFNAWFNILLPYFQQINKKLNFKLVTDIILSNDIFDKYINQVKTLVIQIAIPLISQDVTNNILYGYL